MGGYTLALVGSGLVKRDEERVKTHEEEIVLEGKASEIGIDDFQSNRSLDETYRTCFLRGLFAHMKRGFYHERTLRLCWMS